MGSGTDLPGFISDDTLREALHDRVKELAPNGYMAEFMCIVAYVDPDDAPDACHYALLFPEGGIPEHHARGLLAQAEVELDSEPEDVDE